MKPGDLVIHKQLGKRLTVKSASGGGAMVLCAWMEPNAKGDPVECTSAFDWQDLRYPTEAERANQPEPAAVGVGEPEAEIAAEAVQETHKRKGK